MKLKINGRVLSARSGQTILEVARENKIEIPSLCFHPDLDVKANCRICAVEIAGADKLTAACSTAAAEGMEIFTASERVKKARAINLELILAEHTKKCAGCISLYDCELLRLARTYRVRTDRLSNRKKQRKTYRFANAVEIDNTQCLDCQNCVEVCAKQGVGYLKMAHAGADQEVLPVRDGGAACVYCGQCTLHCPSAAAEEQAAWPEVAKALRDKEKILVAQFAPAVRVSIGEEFGFPSGYNCEGQIYTGLKKLGFQQVTDINFGADITTLVEAEELIERLNNPEAAWPMMTSCCPAWVAYVEHDRPELIPNLTASRSPQIHLGGAIKSYWARKKDISPKKIRVVSIVPCTAKKYEAARSEMYIDGRPAVDYVLTTRELAYLFKKNNIDLKKLPASGGECLFNAGSGAAAIYGASGGVMESALRTAAGAKGGKLAESRLEFREVRGSAGFKEATVTVGGRKLKVGVVSGLGNFQRLVSKLHQYHYIEVMACPGGCIGGGGQPRPTTAAIRQKRLAGLYEIDRARPVRRAHENKAALEYRDWIEGHGLAKKLLLTGYKKRSGSILTVAKPHRA